MLKLKDLLSVEHSESILSGLKPDEKFSGVSIDSRNVSKNEIFFAVKGENFDAHDFLNDVFKKGIKTCCSK
ncbi:MAG: hypothetical protein IPM96_07230 [Ignavibacteria bacterium]|nr:hypothetical protein [Ignavibacteria bacterium]